MGHFCRRLLLGLFIGQCLSWNVSQAVVVSTDASTSASVEQADNHETASSTSQSEATVSTESSAAETVKADPTEEASRAIMFKEAVVATDSYGHELSSGKTVYSGEIVKYQFRVDWQPGSAAIKQLRFQFSSPNYVQFKSAKVTQANG